MNAEETDDGQVQEWRSYEKRRAVCPCADEGKDCACEDDGTSAAEWDGIGVRGARHAAPRARGQAP